MTARTTNATRRSPKGEARRSEILSAALTIFAAKGYHPTSLADIAGAVGLTQAGLLHHFPTKSALVIATLDAWEKRDREARHHSRSGGKSWMEAFVEPLRRNEKNPAHVRFFAVLSHESLAEDHPAHDWLKDRYARVVRSSTEALDNLIDPEKLPAGVTTTTIARNIIAVADGLRLQMFLEPGVIDRPAALEQVFALLRPYLRDAQVFDFTTRKQD